MEEHCSWDESEEDVSSQSWMDDVRTEAASMRDEKRSVQDAS
jgi:hypothetical protein